MLQRNLHFQERRKAKCSQQHATRNRQEAPGSGGRQFMIACAQLVPAARPLRTFTQHRVTLIFARNSSGTFERASVALIA